jgi:hypothetical protein
MVDKELEEYSGNSSNAPILYSPDYDGANVFAISGNYSITGKEIVVSILLTKGGTEIKARMEEKGDLTDLQGLSKRITQTVLAWIKTQ